MSSTRSFLTNEQKLRLREYWGAQPQLTHFEVADWVRAQFQISVSRSTLYRISQASDDAFAGSLSKKKTRRVKFPEFEKELLAYYHAARQSTVGGGGSGVSVGTSGDATANGQSMKTEPLTADSLVRKAVELRAKHGIAHDKLKLSNGWMHKFKERHCLKKSPPATGVVEVEASDHSASEEEGEESKEEAARGARTARAAAETPTTSSAPTPRRAARSAAMSGDASAMVPVTPVSTTREPAVLPSPVATINTPAPPSQHVQPLIHISAKSLSTVRSPGILNWERTSHFSDHQASSTTASHFAIVNNGVQILQDGVYQINVDLQHTTRRETSTTGAGTSSQEVFSVWNGTTRLDQCSSILHCDTAAGVALSVSEVQCFLAANACIRVDFRAPGHALHKSRIVIRLVS